MTAASVPLDIPFLLALPAISAPTGTLINSLPTGLLYRSWYHSGVTDPNGNSTHTALKTVFLDRDGVLNEKMPEGHYVTRWEEFRLLPGVPEAIARLNRAGVRVIVVSNQRGVALGHYTVDDVNTIHQNFQTLLNAAGAQVDAFFFCPHEKRSCTCRKPGPGLFEQARSQFPAIAAETSVMIGDSLSDIEFGRRLGMRTVFIDGDPAHQKPGAASAKELAQMNCRSLAEAVQILLGDRA
jgi:D-glycero-D-manno-heptose 1,7-bisphosphate phosphatase